MSFRDRWFEISWTLRRKWFGVWEVKDYFTNLEKRALNGAEINMGFIMMVVVLRHPGDGWATHQQRCGHHWLDVCGAFPGTIPRGLYRGSFSQPQDLPGRIV